MAVLNRGLGIDLGTANTVVCGPSREVILDEPSVMVVKAGGVQRDPLLVGTEARELVGRTPVGLLTVRPIRDGVITDLQTAKVFIVAILRRLHRRPWQRLLARAVVGVPSGATSLERRALVEAVEEAGVHSVRLVPEPIAGAVGCGTDPLSPTASMVVDVGGGTAEVTAFCYGGILATESSRIAGDEMTLALHQHLRDAHRIVVGELTAEDVKTHLRGDNGPAAAIVIEGRDLISGRPRVVTLDPVEISDALKPTIDGILVALGRCLDRIPAQAVSDIMQHGVLAFGGGSLLRGFESQLEETLGFAVHEAPRPLTCVAEGAAALLGMPQVLETFDQ
jgi:rod shape-determining protein MreB